jgi:phospholipase/carboxylesterase
MSNTPTQTHWRTDRPAEGFYTSALPADPGRCVRTFLPEGYAKGYAYPLLVLFHGRGGNEEQVLRLAPRVSRRNFLAVSFRGDAEIGRRADGQPACAWDASDADRTADAVVQAVAQTRRTCHVHTERVFLVGLGEGAAAAYQAAFALGDKVAGVIALNGTLPRVAGKVPLFRLDQVRRQRVFIGQSSCAPPAAVIDAARDSKLFYAAGADVQLARFKSPVALPKEMLAAVNRWVIDRVCAPVPALAAY